LLRGAELLRLLRRSQLLRDRRERGALPARAPGDQRGSDHDPSSCRSRTCRLRGRAQRGLMLTRIDREHVQKLTATAAQLIEVLPPEEYEDEHLPGAINIPLKSLDAVTARQLDRQRPVIVYCYDYQ